MARRDRAHLVLAVRHDIAARELLDVLGYVLLDWDDEYRIDGLGVLYARQAALAKWPLGEVLRNVGGGGMAALPRLRNEFRAMVAEPVGLVRGRLR